MNLIIVNPIIHKSKNSDDSDKDDSDKDESGEKEESGEEGNKWRYFKYFHSSAISKNQISIDITWQKTIWS